MLYRYLLALFALVACGGNPSGPELGRDPLKDIHLITEIGNRAPTIAGDVVAITEAVRWEFHGGKYRFEIQTQDPGVPLHYSVRRPRTTYWGNYWVTYQDRRVYTLHLERTGGEVFNRADGSRSVPSHNNTELPVIFGVETVTISETDYRYGDDH